MAVIFDSPLACILLNQRCNQFCAFCLHVLPKSGVELCDKCEFAQYCSNNCQLSAWNQGHRYECRRLLKSFPLLPTTEVLFMARLMDNLRVLQESGDNFGWTRWRNFDELLGHKDEIRRNEDKLAHFQGVYKKVQRFMFDIKLERDHFWDVFCKVAVNSYTIKTPLGLEIGMALDLGVSRYDHSCEPNCAVHFNGRNAIISPLLPGVNLDDLSNAYINYVDVARSKFRRSKDLKEKWYFDCQCPRCSSSEILTKIECPSCGDSGDIKIEEDTVISISDEHFKCRKCLKIPQIEYLKEAQTLMLKLPHNFSPHGRKKEEVDEMLKKAEEFLSEDNVYVIRLRLLAIHLKSAREQTQVDPQYFLKVTRQFQSLTFANDPRVACQILHVIRNFCMRQEYKLAKLLALEAVNILRIAFGEKHKFTLKLKKLSDIFQDNEICDLNEVMDCMNLDG